MRPRIAIIVDNPLRDLDGSILVAWHLACAGAEAILVQMYDQQFDIAALDPHVVVANYVRPNNADLLKAYRCAGIRVAVLDTEGNAGKSVDDYAGLVAAMNCGEFVDSYLVWGRRQYEAFARTNAAGHAHLVLTGCPRFDFCAPMWRAALPRPVVRSPFTLINTNFPVVNPRFSKGAENERRTMTRVGFSDDFASGFLRAGRAANAAMVETCARLAEQMPHRHFVLRPHPFESTTAYDHLRSLPNFEIRQEGTSVEWIHASSALVHQNCSTAVEAVMLDREPILLDWFNHPALKLSWACDISRPARSFESLAEELDAVLEGRAKEVPEEVRSARSRVVEDFFYANDGRSSERVASALLELTEKPARKIRVPGRGLRALAMQGARSVLGVRAFDFLRAKAGGSAFADRRQAKQFSVIEVNEVLSRVCRISRHRVTALAKSLDGSGYRRPRLATGRAVAVLASA